MLSCSRILWHGSRRCPQSPSLDEGQLLHVAGCSCRFHSSSSTKTECGYLNGWIVATSMVGLETVTCAKISPKTVKPRGIAGERRRRREEEEEEFQQNTASKRPGKLVCMRSDSSCLAVPPIDLTLQTGSVPIPPSHFGSSVTVYLHFSRMISTVVS